MPRPTTPPSPALPSLALPSLALPSPALPSPALPSPALPSPAPRSRAFDPAARRRLGRSPLPWRSAALVSALAALLAVGCSCDAEVAVDDDAGPVPGSDAGPEPGADAGARDGGPATDGGADGGDCTDRDGDGVTDCGGDCDDGDPLTYPSAAEVCGDGVDNACGDDPDPAARCMAIGTFVSPAGDDATGDGTRDNPVRTVGAGIANAVAIGGATTVVVGGGDYLGAVTMVEGVSVQGGFDCASLPCGWAYDPSANETVLDGGDANEAVLADASITRATALLDVTVRSERAAIRTTGALTARRVRLEARQGLLAFGGSSDPLLEDSVVVAVGDGVALEDAGEVRRSQISGATAARVRGPSLLAHNVLQANGGEGVWIGGDARVEGNVVNEAPGGDSACNAMFCAGIAIWGGSPRITNNVVFAPGGVQSSAIAIVHGELVVDEPTIHSNTLYATRGSRVSAGVSCQSFFGIAEFGELRNNLVIGTGAATSYGYYEVDGGAGTTCRPVLVEHNLFFDVDHVARFAGPPQTLFDTPADADAETWAANNLSGDPLLDASHRLMAGSPGVDQGTATDAPPVDRDGQPRPAGGGHDIGADER